MAPQLLNMDTFNLWKSPSISTEEVSSLGSATLVCRSAYHPRQRSQPNRQSVPAAVCLRLWWHLLETAGNTASTEGGL